MLVVGADVHVRNSFLCVTDEAGQTLRSGRVANRLGDVAAFMGPLEHHPLRVSLESTTNSRAICVLWNQYAREAGVDLDVQVLDARKLRIIAESVNKCDRVDAAILAELTRSGLSLPTCYMPDDEVFTLREHLRARVDLVRMRTMLKNRVHAVLHRRGVLTPRGSLFTRAGRTWLDEVTLDEAGRIILNRYLDLLDVLEERVREMMKEIRQVSQHDRWLAPAGVAQTMPGVGLITAMTVLAELGDLHRFRSRGAVANYAGLVPVQRCSNEKNWRGGITHRGSSHLRRALVEAAWVAVTRAPRYEQQYERIKERRGCQTAIVAVARRMLEDLFTMITRNRPFRHDPHSKDRSRSEQSIASSAAG